MSTKKGAPATSPSRPDPTVTVFTLPLSELDARIAKAIEHAAAIEALLPGLVTMTAEDRQSSPGKFRDGEAEALAPLIDGAIAHPNYYDVLADEDEGQDPNRFEPELVKDRLLRRNQLARLSPALGAVAQKVGDTELDLGEKTRPVLLALHEITKPLAKRKPELKAFAARALDFFSAIGQKAAKARKAAQKAKAAKDAASAAQ